MTYPTSDIDALKLRDDDSNIVNWTTSPFSYTQSGGVYNISFAFFDETGDFTGTYLENTDLDNEALTGSSDKEFIKTAFSTVLENTDPYAVSFADVSNLNFSENTTGTADIVIVQTSSSYFSSAPTATAATFVHSNGASQDLHGDIAVNANLGTWSDNGNDSGDAIVSGEFSWRVIHEEILHTLGIDIQGSTLSGDTTKDNNQYTVTSYNPLDGMGTTSNPSSGVYPSGLQLYDIAALQEIYGANNSTRSGDTTYKHGQGFGASASDAFIYTIWDGGGTDTIDVSAYADGVVLDLREGHFSSIGVSADTSYSGSRGTGLADDNVAIAFNTEIENAIGTSSNDTIMGNDLSNEITGGQGDDTLQGGAGVDTYIYNLGDGQDTITEVWSQVNKVSFGLGIDRSDAEYVKSGNDLVLEIDASNSVTLEEYFSQNGTINTTIEFADLSLASLIVGDSAAQIIVGSANNDVIYGEGGNDTLLYGFQGDDTVFGGDGNDVLIAGYGSDSLFGEAGNDTLQAFGEQQYLDGGSGGWDNVLRLQGISVFETNVDTLVTNGTLIVE